MRRPHGSVSWQSTFDGENLYRCSAARAAAWPLAARGQPSERVRRVGVLTHFAADDPEGQLRIIAFEQGMRELGWAVGRNLQIDYTGHDLAN